MLALGLLLPATLGLPLGGMLAQTMLAPTPRTPGYAVYGSNPMR